MRDGANRSLVSSAAFDLLILRAQIGVFGADRRVGGLDERCPQVRVAVAGPARFALAGGLVVAGANRCPARGVAIGREAAHVWAELREDHLCCAGGDAIDRGQQLSLVRERGEPLLNLLGQRGDRLVQVVDVREDLRDDQRVVRFEVPRERLLFE